MLLPDLHISFSRGWSGGLVFPSVSEFSTVYCDPHKGGFPGGSPVKHLPTMQETWVPSLGQKDPLEKEMATHSSILAWRIPWTEELGGLQSTGRKELDTTERIHFHFHFISDPRSDLSWRMFCVHLRGKCRKKWALRDHIQDYACMHAKLL